jgi:hypothetical protein
MPITSKEIEQIRTTIDSSLKPLLPVAGVAAPQALAIEYGVDLLFRGIILGFQIKEAREAAQEEREKITGGRGLPYWPIPVDLKEIEIRRFFVDQVKIFEERYPLLFSQLKDEISIFSQRKPIEKVKESFRVLVVAHDVASAIYDSRKFEDEALQTVFGKYLSEDPPKFGALAREYASLRGGFETDATLTEYAKTLSSMYWHTRREADDIIEAGEVAEIDRKLQEKIQGLWLNFAFGKDGLVDTTTKFVVDFTKEDLKAEKQRYEKRIGALEASTDPAKGSLIAVLEQKIKRIDEKLKNL